MERRRALKSGGAQIAFGEGQTDASVVREACTALQHLSKMQSQLPEHLAEVAHQGLVSVLVGSALPESGWYAAAEAALHAVYALYPSPAALCTAVLRRLARTAFGDISGVARNPQCVRRP